MSPFLFWRPLVGSLRALTSAELAALKCIAAARKWLPPRRAPFGRKESQPWAGVPPAAVPSPFARRPPRTPPLPRSAAPFPLGRAIAACPWSGEDRKTRGFWFWLKPPNLATLLPAAVNGDLRRGLARGDRAVPVGAPSEG